MNSPRFADDFIYLAFSYWVSIYFDWWSAWHLSHWGIYWCLKARQAIFQTYHGEEKRCSVRLYLQLFVGGRMSYLRYLCLFAYSGVLCVCFIVLRLMNPMLLVSLDCQFVIAPSVSSYVYLYFYDIMIAPSVSSYVYLYFYDIMIAPSVSSYVYLYFYDIMIAPSVSPYVYLYFYDIMIAPSVSSYVYLYFCDIMMMSALYKTNTFSLLSIILSEWNNRPWATCRSIWTHNPDSGITSLCSYLCMLYG